MSFGSWIAMHLLMRRPDIEGFVSIAAPANRFDFSFLAPARVRACSSMANSTGWPR